MRAESTDLRLVRLLLKTWLTGQALSALATTLDASEGELPDLVTLATNLAEEATKRLEPDIAELAERVESLVFKQVLTGEPPPSLDPDLFKGLDIGQ